MAEPTTSPWGLYALMVFCIIMAISGFVWDVMRAAGLSRLVPPQYMQPSFMNRGGYQRKRSGDEEEGWEEEIDMDVLQDEAHDSSVEYDYDLSDDDQSDNETENKLYPRRPR
ncbi:hypothetical protein KI688_010683 [Linnemannia hyalina]|uniref:Uncharacterized protein n=1 Tax=Linnemannia hyalina TaxID=64524 RepID=A0A9P7XW42_9FUNG|nr:hypothetical protein KI688_010683 [Linnemannia hyalina]